jgi:hypothetical protein
MATGVLVVLGIVIVGLMLGSVVTPFLGIPLLVLFLMLPVVYGVISKRLNQPTLQSDHPSTREAAYEPGVDPAERRP